MTTKILIARHGNTFAKGDIIRRVGARTDIPLVSSGLKQGRMLGAYLKENNVQLAGIFSSPLIRAKQTAEEALKILGQEIDIIIDNSFNEIDYGEDDGKPEAEVVKKIGKIALQKWDERAIPPKGWLVDPDKIIADWQNFAQKILQDFKDKTVLVVTSNGTARFAPHLTGDFQNFKKNYQIKLSTGAISALTYDELAKNWQVQYWNLKPKEWLEDHNIDTAEI